jgi:hypothetical protein
MIITTRDTLILKVLARYYVLDRRQVQQLCFPKDPDGRVARRRLAALVDAGLIYRHSTLVASSHDGPLASVYLLTAKGCQHLADRLGDAAFLYKPVHLPHRLHVVHALAVAELHILLDTAVAAESGVTLEAWYNEHDIINAADPDPYYHYRLRTKFTGDPDIICSPDAGFLLNQGGWRAAYYLELERSDGHHGTGCRQLAERKCPGYAEVARHGVYRQHFPGAEIDGFRVLLVAPHERRRDGIRRAFAEKDPVEFRTDLWRFAALTDITVESLLSDNIYYRCGGGPAEQLLPAG